MKFLIAGPCAIESEQMCIDIAGKLQEISPVPLYFKASFDKANRTSAHSFRGIGFDAGLQTLQKVKDQLGVKILTDVHDQWQIPLVAEVADVMQIPAFLCRQTDFITGVAVCGKTVNIKKGQFLSPYDMKHVVEKAEAAPEIWVTDRGTSFGYGDLVADMRSLVIMRDVPGVKVIFDATHSVQQPGALGGKSGGRREFVAPLARAAVAVGIDGLFIETHPDPGNALSDGQNMVPLHEMKPLLDNLVEIDNATKPR